MTPLVSVIVPNYNHEKYLSLRIESVLSQTYQNIEIILLDDASSDNSAAVLQSYSNEPRVKHIIINAENSGSTFIQWKRGLSLCSGEYVWIAESDDVAHTFFLSEILSCFQQEEAVVMAFCQSLDIDDKGLIVSQDVSRFSNGGSLSSGQNFVANGEDFYNCAMVSSNSIPNVSAVVFRKEILDNQVDLALGMRYAGDWMVYNAMLSVGDIAYSPRRLNAFRSHSVTTRYSKSIDDQVVAYSEVIRILDFSRCHGLLSQDKFEYETQRIKDVIKDLQRAAINMAPVLARYTNKPIAVYGAGGFGTLIANVCETECVEIVCFVDRRASSKFNMHLNIPVISLGNLDVQEVEGIYIASVAFYDEIKKELTLLGFGRHVIN